MLHYIMILLIQIPRTSSSFWMHSFCGGAHTLNQIYGIKKCMGNKFCWIWPKNDHENERDCTSDSYVIRPRNRIRQLLLGRHHRKHSEKHYHNILLLYPTSSKLYFLILPLTNGHHIKFYFKRGSRILSLERYCISAKMNFGTQAILHKH